MTVSPRVLIFADYYLPGFLAGGPIRAIQNLIDQLGDEFEFSVVTRDRDLGQREPYPSLRGTEWVLYGKSRVKHLPPSRHSLRTLRALLEEVRPDAVYFNSAFSRWATLWPLIAARMARSTAALLVSPRGEFSAGAMGLKRRRKLAYLRALRSAGLLRHVRWCASSEPEVEDIRRVAGADAAISPLPDLAPRAPAAATRARLKRPGELRIAFLSRISPMKNLHVALEACAGLGGDVEFHIYGPREDPAYWNLCELAIQRLSSNVRVRVHGPVPHPDVVATLAEHDVFFLPSRGENFGYVVLEALAAGCIPLLSDRTPWDVGARGAGWALPAADTAGFRAALERCVEMDATTFQRHSLKAQDLAATYRGDRSLLDQARATLLEAVRKGSTAESDRTTSRSS